MQDILVKASCYIAIIFLGYILRRTGYLGPEAFGVLSKILLKITLPCAIISSNAGKAIDSSMLTIVLLSFGAGVLYMFLGSVIYKPKGKDAQAFGILNIPGYNIGTFAMPFTQNFLGPMGNITTSIFDMGNALICLGGAYCVAASVKEGKGFDIKRILKNLVTSVPCMTIIIMVVLNLFSLIPPKPIVAFAQIIGNANAFLAMFTIGVGFKLTGDRSQFADMAKILGTRYGVATVLALIFYFVLPFELEVRQALVILAFSPIGSAIPVFTAELKGDVGLSAAINSVAIVISIVIIVVLLVVML
jgi:predicted permease